ncbi:hypothetical protein QYM36_006374 [Artemia franciscana]|uniref:Integrase catalytic domain-containing protein n=1 Tax=Artemia franciscana TaxID=6661 RepID=A0AA88HV01_ARTSF|nr:hypothetical protein QYM36_006374 [Artemia franciscana]
MDIVGPLKASQNGYRFLLVISDYTTRYPEALPVRTTNARTIGEVLVQFFFQVGVPFEILANQGSNILSKSLREVYRMLGIREMETSPYHPQTHGLVERLN